MNAHLQELLAKKPWNVKPAQVMRRFSDLVKASWTSAVAKGEPIVFDMAYETWTYDPKNRDLVREGDTPSARLRICSTPAALMDVLNDPKLKVDPYRVVAVGDWSVITPVIDALRTNQSPLALRASISART